ncbi:MAG: hypothetical protein WAX67_07120, partial [Rugosibacter sp.]
MHFTASFIPPTREKSGHAEAAMRILKRLLRNFHSSAALRLWNDATHHIGLAPPAFTLVIRDPAILRKLVLRPSALVLADAYFRGLLDVEGDLYSV